MTIQPKMLCEMEVGDRAFVYALLNEKDLRRRLQDLGMIEDTEVECIGKSPGGGLRAYLIRGAVIAVRDEDARRVLILPQAREG